MKQRFSNFGNYEDAMLEDQNFLFHSCLSVNMNIGLLTPKEVVKKALKYEQKESMPINSLEGIYSTNYRMERIYKRNIY